MTKALFLALALLVSPAHAELTGWTLALTWEPGFCAVTARAASCAGDIPRRLVLHGLWTEGMGEEFCGVPKRMRTEDSKRAWCSLPVPRLKPGTRDVLNRAMPGTADCLDHHEWTKHGTCSGMDADRYFTAATDLAARADKLEIARLLSRRAGGTISLAELDAAITKDFGPEGVKAVLPVCSNRRGLAHLQEIRISLDAQRFLDFPKMRALLVRDRWQDPRCPADQPINLGP